MPISFQCPKCGKKLKAPDSAAGRSSTCPGCGGTVTCPEADDDGEVVEMQLTPVKPKGFDPFADVDSDKPYGVARPEPPAIADADLDATPGLKRPGKTKSGKGKKKAELKSIATYQRYLIICILILIPTNIAYFASLRALQSNPAKPAGGTIAIFGLSLIVSLIFGLAATVFAFLLTKKISNVGMAILVVLLTLIPCVGLISLFVVSGKATKRLRDAGIDVGFLGADMSVF
jgi:hypothetical protein